MRLPAALGVLRADATTEQGLIAATLEGLRGFNLAGNHIQLVIHRRENGCDFLLFWEWGNS